MLPTTSVLWSQVESMALRGTVILALAVLGTQLLHRSSAAARHLVWRLALLAVLATPVLSALLPAWELALPAASTNELVADLYLSHPPGAPPTLADAPPTTLAARVRALPGTALRIGRAPHSARLLSARVLSAVFLGGLLFCLARLALGWLAVRLMLGRAREVTDPSWTNLVQNLATRARAAPTGAAPPYHRSAHAAVHGHRTTHDRRSRRRHDLVGRAPPGGSCCTSWPISGGATA